MEVLKLIKLNEDNQTNTVNVIYTFFEVEDILSKAMLWGAPISWQLNVI